MHMYMLNFTCLSRQDHLFNLCFAINLSHLPHAVEKSPVQSSCSQTLVQSPTMAQSLDQFSHECPICDGKTFWWCLPTSHKTQLGKTQPSHTNNIHLQQPAPHLIHSRNSDVHVRIPEVILSEITGNKVYRACCELLSALLMIQTREFFCFLNILITCGVFYQYKWYSSITFSKE